LNHQIHIFPEQFNIIFKICLEQLKFRRTLNALGVRELSVSGILRRPHGLYGILGKNGEDTVQIQLGDQFVRKNSTFLHQKLMVQIIDVFGDGHAGNQLGDRQPFHKYSAPYHEKKI